MKVAVLRIAGQVKNKMKDNETLKRLKLNKKFTLTLLDSDDKVRMGMIASVAHMVVYGEISEELIKELKTKRKEKDGIFFLHPPRGGFKKSSKVAAPKGILGKNSNIDKLLERML
jgi:ribosomal protein L30/L7E